MPATNRVPFFWMRFIRLLLSPRGVFRPFSKTSNIWLHLVTGLTDSSERFDLVKFISYVLGTALGLGLIVYLPLMASFIYLVFGYVLITATHEQFFYWRLSKADIEMDDAVERQMNRNSALNGILSGAWVVAFIGTIYPIVASHFGIQLADLSMVILLIILLGENDRQN
jgi:uncharacterized membrane protein